LAADVNKKNIHKGGLVKIKGTIYKITNVSGNTINHSGTFSDTAQNNVAILFAVANVVDSNDKSGSIINSTKGYGFGYYNNNVESDEDNLVESFNKQGTTWIWDATIRSANLPDGPITLHIVAIDKAGNASEYPYNATINNNGPRIAGMWIGTDENGNGSVDDAEFDKTTYHNIYANGKQGNEKKTNVTFPVQGESPTYAIKAKGKTEIKPEVVGGNGQLSYTYDVYYRDDGDWNTTAYSNTTPSVMGTGSVDSAATISNNITLNVEDFVKKIDDTDNEQIGDGEYHKFAFHIGDKTPAATSNGNSQSATLNVIMNVALRDSNPANNYILPFYWNSSSSNSLFNNSKDNGHIELATDWVFASGYDETTSGEYDNDPKVSGKIKLEGIAQDEGVLKEIKVQFDKSMGGLGTTDTTIASYSNGTWTCNSTLTNGAIPTASGTTQGWAAEVSQATYGELVNTKLFNADDGFNLDAKVTDDETKLGTTVNNVKLEYLSTSKVPYTTQEFGHVVHWTLYLDTAYINNVAATDVIVTAKATDKGKPTWSGSAVDYTSNTATVTGTGYSCAVTKSGNTPVIGAYTGQYKMDVVPYITGITTELSAGNKKRPTVLSRSALGVYPVRRGSNITVEGFNLNGTSSRVLVDTQEYTPITGTTTSSLIIKTDENTTSKGVVAKTGTVESLNNKTLKTVEYNQEPNGQNNDILTDKRELYVLDVTTTTDTTDKRMLDMAINGSTLTFGAGYGPNYYSSMTANGVAVQNVKNLRQSFTRYFDNAIAINDSGAIFTVSACGDSYHTVTGWDNGPSHLALSKGNPGTNIREYNGTNTNNNTSLIFLESNWNGANLNNLDRFKLPDLIVKGTTGSTKGYLTYYDTTQKIIKFRYFTDGTNVASNYTTYTNGSVPTDSLTGNNAQGCSTSIEGTVNNYTPTGSTNVYTQGYIAIAGADENSQYSSVGVIGETAIVSWYDAANGALKMKYNISPSTSYSGYQTFSQIPSTTKYTYTEGNTTYNFTYNATRSSFYDASINQNQGGKYVKIGNDYYEITYKGNYSIAGGNKRHYTISGYDSTENFSSVLYTRNSVTDYGGDFNISVDGQAAKPISLFVTPITNVDNNHEFAYQLNLLLSDGYGAYAEVDPKTKLVTVRSMQTGTGSSISITGLSSGVNTAVPGTGNRWELVTVDENSAGQYVSMKTDSKGGIHFAYYDTGNGDLKYAYMSSVTATPKVVTVDGYQQVGQYVDLALKETTSGTTTSVTPYISYYSMSNADTNRAAKVAKLVSPVTYTTSGNTVTANTTVIPAGSTDEMFTGDWEVMHIPTNGIPVQYRVNIGVTTGGNVYISYLADRTIEYVKVE
jgi:hypothetical protein